MCSFSFVSGVSGSSLFNSVSLMAYNVFYTSIPVLVSVLDKDLNEKTVMQHPQILFYCQAGRFVLPCYYQSPFFFSLIECKICYSVEGNGSFFVVACLFPTYCITILKIM